MKTILVVEDNIDVHNLIKEILEKEHLNILDSYSGTEALMVLEKEKVDLILLDLMLPGLDGEEIIKKIKDIPIIVISAKISTEDKVKALLEGANDYITKPFEPSELVARIRVQLRLQENKNGNIKNTNNENKDVIEAKDQKLKFKELILDNDNHILYIKVNSNIDNSTEKKINFNVDNSKREKINFNVDEHKDIRWQSIYLTKTEYAILKQLLLNPKQVIAKSKLLDLISNDTLDCDENSLKVHISNIRKKIRSVTPNEYIESVWGIGFKLKE